LSATGVLDKRGNRLVEKEDAQERQDERDQDAIDKLASIHSPGSNRAGR
jgi:hypothetical protein